MSDWIRIEAEKVKAENLRQQHMTDAKTRHAAMIAQTSSVFWNDLVAIVQSDVAAWNAEFPNEPDQQLAIELLQAQRFRLLRPSRARLLSVESSETGVTCDPHAKTEDRPAGRRDLPVWQWAVDTSGVIGVRDEKRTLTGAALSELLIRRLLDSPS
jgi:hypothetical protein